MIRILFLGLIIVNKMSFNLKQKFFIIENFYKNFNSVEYKELCCLAFAQEFA
jgi:hypothetical protein